MKINNWDYQLYLNDDNKFIANVTPDINIPKPNTLSKYYALNANNINCLINRNLYASEPSNLNDIFDSIKLSIDFSKISNEEFKRHVDTEIINHENLDKALLSEDRTQILNAFRDGFYYTFLSENGILSMTKEHNSDLMWAHYTQNKGFLIEFNIDQFDNDFFKGPFKINYVPKLTKYLLEDKNDYLDVLLSSFLTKKNIWSYEDEFRFLCTPNDGFQFKVNGGASNDEERVLQERFVNYSKSAIKKIILGFSFFESNEVIERKGLRNDIVLFTGETGILKSCLLNEIIREEIPLEIICLDSGDFEFRPAKCIVKHLGGSKYETFIDTESLN